MIRKQLFWLSGEERGRLEPLLPKGRRGARRVISGIVHMLRSGARWRDCPPEYGPYTTIYNRYNHWSQRRVWQRMFAKMAAAGPIPDELSIDSSHVKAHRSASGSKRMARPVGKRLEIDGLISLQKRIRPFGEAPLAKMEIRAS